MRSENTYVTYILSKIIFSDLDKSHAARSMGVPRVQFRVLFFQLGGLGERCKLPQRVRAAPESQKPESNSGAQETPKMALFLMN